MIKVNQMRPSLTQRGTQNRDLSLLRELGDRMGMISLLLVSLVKATASVYPKKRVKIVFTPKTTKVPIKQSRLPFMTSPLQVKTWIMRSQSISRLICCPASSVNILYSESQIIKGFNQSSYSNGQRQQYLYYCGEYFHIHDFEILVSWIQANLNQVRVQFDWVDGHALPFMI